ncbi:MAG: phosphatidate cytidylyltransferase [Oscillibacter sp.]|nr:phosphatidate cytidylyltransferase [Oscillibacter sp.]
MKQRWLVVFLGLPLMLLVLLACPPWATGLLVCGVAAIAAYELLHVAGKGADAAVYTVTIAATICQVILLYCCYAYGDLTFSAPLDPLWLAPLVLTCALFLLAVTRYGTERAVPFSTVAVGFLGGAAFPMAYGCVLLLRMHEAYGKLYVLAPFCIAFVGDAFSMYGGMLFGKKKLAPAVSPHKTVAGAIAGPIGSVLALLLFGFIGSRLTDYAPNYAILALLGVVGNLFGQLGDLSMSVVKREAGLKDYSRLFLTHGGMLDRFDSSMFIAPVVYLFVALGMI